MAPMPAGSNDQRIIDAKLPLPWLIGCACAIVFSMGGVFVKLDNVNTALNKIEAKTDNRDDRITTLAATLIQQQGKNDTQDAAILRIQTDVIEIRRTLDETRKNQRWMPK